VSGPTINQASLWHKLLPPASDHDKPTAKRREYCKNVIDLVKERHPDLYAGSVGAVLTVDETQALMDSLQKNSPGHIFKHRISYLIRVLEQGSSDLNWDVIIPDPPLVIPRDKPRFSHENFMALPDVYTVEEAFLKHLKHEPPPTYTSRVGQMLLSAMLFGGLIRKKWLTPWVEAIPSAISSNSLLWLDMVLKSEHAERERRAKNKAIKPDHIAVKEAWEIRQRWLADPLTHALIIRWHSMFPEEMHAGRIVSPLVAVSSYLSLILNAGTRIPESFVTNLLSGCATRLGLQVPSFLRSYAEGRVKSVTLPESVWIRLVRGKCVQPSDNSPVITEALHPIDELRSLPMYSKPSSPARQERMLRELLRIILPPGSNWKRDALVARKEIQNYLDLHLGEMCQALYCLAFWCIDLLTPYNRQDLANGRVKGKLRASSVRRYLDAIGKHLISSAGTLEILDLDGDELHDLYADVIEACPTANSKNTAGARLYAFHQFLLIRLQAPQVDFSDLSGCKGPAEASVDANLISFASFDQIKRVLCPNYVKASRLRKMQLLIAIIAFRCGLRRSEVLKLRLIDLQGLTEPELLIRTNRYGYVKSNESIRRLPLASLLEDDELQLLLEWKNERNLEDGQKNSDALLFCLKSQSTQRLSGNDIFAAIMQSVHQVTGDRNLVFHHFRHSFATWLLLRLIQVIPENSRQRFHFMQHPLFNNEACNKLRSALLGNQQLGRQALYAVAQLCGHAGPEVTLLHYFHLCELLLHAELSLPDNQPLLDAATIMTITGLKEHIVYYEKRAAKADKCQMGIYLGRLVVPDRLMPQHNLHTPSLKPVPDESFTGPETCLPLWTRVFAIIRQRQIGRIPFSALAERSGFSEDEIRGWYANLEIIADMKTGRGKYRHINSATSDNNKLFHFPQQTRLREDKILSDSILATFESSRGKTRKKILEAARYFINHFTAAKGAVRCQSIMELKKYLDYIRFLGILPDQIHVSRLPARDTRVSSLDQHQQLAIKLNLPSESISILKVENGNTYINGYFQAQVVNAEPDGSGKVKANYGFRFAMYLIAIMAGLSSEC